MRLSCDGFISLLISACTYCTQSESLGAQGEILAHMGAFVIERESTCTCSSSV